MEFLEIFANFRVFLAFLCSFSQTKRFYINLQKSVQNDISSDIFFAKIAILLMLSRKFFNIEIFRF